MFPLIKLVLFPLLFLFLAACSEHESQRTPQAPLPVSPPDTVQENTLYTNMNTYGQYMGCSAATKNIGGPQAGWVKSPSLPGTYEEYLGGWESGFRKCRTGRGPEETPGGPVVPPGDLFP